MDDGLEVRRAANKGTRPPIVSAPHDSRQQSDSSKHYLIDSIRYRAINASARIRSGIRSRTDKHRQHAAVAVELVVGDLP
ncbi:hypothetical protein, partial [Diaphorobacter sp.]|uniref:hypothetical protein n=1 Tax=Diaphorobacter sp. TaxID=1934310 RepID=UPI003D0A2E4B